ncbi:diacylglycerol/polyprenol kinase family protein [Halapricum desulfuricans]|uniref:Dolichol kinase n=1 Tax=Halapricum desulfuricans TaxID=2841257 RepID=A0A897NBX4_9EURY|nr:Dolichol kinase [Halapricum desulfuricans]
MHSLVGGLGSEVARRGVHVSGSALPLAYVVNVLTWGQVQAILVAALAAVIVLEVIRLGIGLDWWIYEYLTREYEQDNLAGYALAVISATAVVLIAPPPIAVPALLMLTLGDPISGLLASGRIQSVGDGRYLELILKAPRALAVTFVVCTTIGLAFVAPVAALFGGFAATVADGVKPVIATYVIDDNLTIPLASAAGIALGLAIV